MYELARGRGERRIRFDGTSTMHLRFDDDVERAIYLYGLYEFRSARAFCRLLDRRSTVVDVGAHVGQYTLLAAKRAAHVVAFEPSAATRARLERNVRDSGLDNVEVHPYAVGDSDGDVQIGAAEPGNSGTAAIVGSGGTAVPMRTLDSVLGDRVVDVLKIDVEGGEAGVLAGAANVLRARPSILMEVNGAAAVDALRALDYGIHALGKDGRLVLLRDGDDPRDYAEPWSAPNIVAMPSVPYAAR